VFNSEGRSLKALTLGTSEVTKKNKKDKKWVKMEEEILRQA